MTHLVKETTTLLFKMFINNSRFAIQSKDGKKYCWSNNKLTAAYIRKHISGDITVGVSPLNGVLSKWGVIDIDVCDDMVEKVKTISRYLKLKGFYHAVESSGTGYHIWIFPRKPIEASHVRRFIQEIVKDCEVEDVEIFPKQDGISADVPLGNLVKLPWGVNRKSGKRGLFVDEHLQPFASAKKILPAQIEFLKKLPLVDPDMILEYVGIDEQDSAFLENAIETIYENCAKVRELKKKAEIEHHLDHQERFNLARVFCSVPGGIEEIHKVLSRCSDYSERRTETQIRSIQNKNYYPPSCGSLCGCGKSNPTAFARR